MSGGPRPPRWAVRVVGRLLPASVRDPYLGDLLERFGERAARDGERVARRWFARQALGFLVRVPVERWIFRPAAATVSGLSRASFGMGQDLRYASRCLRKRPGFSLPVILILAVGVAATSVVFAFVDAVLVRDLPYEDPDSLVMLWDLTDDGRADPHLGLGYAGYQQWSERADLFAGVGAFESASPAVVTGVGAERINGMLASPSVFRILGATPELGRIYDDAEDTVGGPHVVVISDRLWRTRFGADPDLVGRQIQINGEATTVVGVMPPGFWFYDPYMFIRSSGGRDTAYADVWLPLHTRDWADPGWRDYPALRVLARLRDGVAVAAAADAVRAASATMPRPAGREAWRTEVVGLKDQVVAGVRPRLLMLLTACLLVMLVASANVMSLVLGRGLSRSGELAVRAAVGASSWRVRRLVAGEALLLGAAGGIVGVAIAERGLAVAVRLAPRALPLAGRVALNSRVLAFGLALGVVAGLLGGLLPALRIRPGRLAATMGTSAGRATEGRAQRRTQSALVAVEVAVTVTLLIAAVMLLRSFLDLDGADTGFDDTGVLTFRSITYYDSEQPPPFDAFFVPFLERLRGLPAVEAAGASSHLPFGKWLMEREFVVGDEQPDRDMPGPRASFSQVTDGYFAAAGIALRAGRAFRPEDDRAGEPVVVVDEAFAEAYLDGNAVGARFGLVSRSRELRVNDYTVVGVVDTVKQWSLAEPDRPHVYAAFRQQPSPMLTFVVRSARDPLELAPSIRAVARQIDPRQPLEEFARWDLLVDQSLTEERFYSRLLLLFGFAALSIAAVGVYGTVTYGVGLRLPEVGIRKAFGAGTRSVASLVLAQGLAPVAVGAVGGVAGAALATRSLRALLHEVSPLDPASFALGVVVVLLVAVGAALPPVRRAVCVNPVDTLRTD